MQYLFLAFLITFSFHAQAAKLKVVTTLPDVAEVVQAIGGEFVEVQSLLKGSEDPHYAEARPDYILKVNRADIVCAVGLELEIGWLPKILEKAGNAKVQSGGPGFCALGDKVTALDIPSGVINRSLGDVHPHGNPHFMLSLEKVSDSGAEVVRVLSLALPDKASVFEKNYDAFKKRLSDAKKELSASLRKGKVLEYHKEFTYFFNSYGLESLGSLEEKPGMPPSAARIAKVAQLAKENKVTVLLATTSAPHKVLERFQELSGVPVVQVPSYVQSFDKSSAKNIIDLQKVLVKAIP